MDIFGYFEELEKTDSGFKKESEVQREYLECVEAFRAIREKAGLTQKELAKKSGLTQQAISRMEVYNNAPNLETVIKYLNACGVSLSELLRISLDGQK